MRLRMNLHFVKHLIRSGLFWYFACLITTVSLVAPKIFFSQSLNDLLEVPILIVPVFLADWFGVPKNALGLVVVGYYVAFFAPLMLFQWKRSKTFLWMQMAMLVLQAILSVVYFVYVMYFWDWGGISFGPH